MYPPFTPVFTPSLLLFVPTFRFHMYPPSTRKCDPLPLLFLPPLAPVCTPLLHVFVLVIDLHLQDRNSAAVAERDQLNSVSAVILSPGAPPPAPISLHPSREFYYTFSSFFLNLYFLAFFAR